MTAQKMLLILPIFILNYLAAGVDEENGIQRLESSSNPSTSQQNCSSGITQEDIDAMQEQVDECAKEISKLDRKTSCWMCLCPKKSRKMEEQREYMWSRLSLLQTVVSDLKEKMSEQNLLQVTPNPKRTEMTTLF